MTSSGGGSGDTAVFGGSKESVVVGGSKEPVVVGNNAGPAVSFDQFYSEVKEIEKADSVLTSGQQIGRLLRAGSSYFNLNPFDVLQVDPDLPLSTVKQRYRRLSLLVHPDKNQDDVERSQLAFEAVSKAWKTLENEEGYKQCQSVVVEAKDRVDEQLMKKRREAKRAKSGPIPEDTDKEKMRHAIYVQTCKLFADLERLRQNEETKQANEKKRKVQEDEEAKDAADYDKEWKKNFEESRDDRASSWMDFKKKAKKSRAPKLKPEER